MIHLVLPLLVSATLTDQASVVDVIKDDPLGLERGVATAKEGVDSTVINAIFNQCDVIKKMFRQEYEDITPDLSTLAIDFYTRDISVTYKLSAAAELLPASPWFMNQNKIIIYIHGFTGSPRGETFMDVNQAFLKQGEYNIVALDASSLLDISTLYVRATTNVQYIGQTLGAVLVKIVKNGTDPSSIYLIGHSLGSQIASFAGKTFTAMTGQRVGRITGLDPAGPCFASVDASLKLNASDADFVDVIHTNAGVFGLDEQRGHVDFYPNGGSVQTGCLTEVCSHARVFKLYAETVLFPENMPATACGSWEDFKNGRCNTSDVSYMGYGCANSTRGRYYLVTAGSEPYGKGDAGAAYDPPDVLGKIGASLGIE